MASSPASHPGAAAAVPAPSARARRRRERAGDAAAIAARIFFKPCARRHGLSTPQGMGHGAYMLPWWLGLAGITLGALVVVVGLRLGKKPG